FGRRMDRLGILGHVYLPEDVACELPLKRILL
ncbi:MAG: hypothetical protein ACJA06_001469, partial [Halocynthiibacter sp.]